MTIIYICDCGKQKTVKTKYVCLDCEIKEIEKNRDKNHSGQG